MEFGRLCTLCKGDSVGHLPAVDRCNGMSHVMFIDGCGGRLLTTLSCEGGWEDVGQY